MIWLIRTMEPETGNAWMPWPLLQTLDPKLLHLAHCPGDLLEKAELPENQMKLPGTLIGEQARVHMFEEGLRESNSPEELGSLLRQSHGSSSEFFENSVPELDHLVDLLNEDDEVLGARLTGGGFEPPWPGQAKVSAREKARSIASAYERKWQVLPTFHTFSASRGAHCKDPLDKG